MSLRSLRKAAGGAGSRGKQNVPIPDPSILTTEALEREIGHLRELIEARLDQMDIALIEARNTSEKAVEAARVSSQTAVEAAISAARTAIIEFDNSITRRLIAAEELSLSRFITYRTLLDSNAEKVALALDAANKAVDKAEIFNEKRFDIISKQIDELKTVTTLTAGRTVGGAAMWGYVTAGIMLVVALASTVISIIVTFNS